MIELTDEQYVKVIELAQIANGETPDVTLSNLENEEKTTAKYFIQALMQVLTLPQIKQLREQGK